MNRRLLIGLALVILVLGIYRLHPRDIRADVSRTEKAVLSVLVSHGMTAQDILFREENEWKKSGIRGRSLDYIVELDKEVKAPDLEEEIAESIKDDKAVRLSRVKYRAGEGKRKGAASFEIRRKGNVILTLTVENVLPGWIEGAKKSSGYAEESKQKKEDLPAVALVLDDFGNTTKNLNAIKEIDVPLTLAVLPNAPYSRRVSSFAAGNKMEVILHLPMEPEGEKALLEKETVLVSMSEEDVKNIIARALRTVPSATGVSNHQGSRATKDERIMEIVLKDIKRRGLFFLDSLTTRGSVGEQAADKEQVLYIKRDLFLDREPGEEYVKKQLEKAERLARSKGRAIVIGHERPVTIKALQEIIPKMKERGIEFVTLSEMIELKDRGQGSRQ
jgi:polysaccharide deacetylase 2 family uncharacterized protein YibQ